MKCNCTKVEYHDMGFGPMKWILCECPEEEEE